jgi:hypothetical protein
MFVCMSLMVVRIDLSMAANPESPNREILNQKHWSLGRRWTTWGTTWKRRGSTLLGLCRLGRRDPVYFGLL